MTTYEFIKVTDTEIIRSELMSESEFIRRLNLICDEMHSPGRSIEILLKGE